jgi:hypothetical protein
MRRPGAFCVTILLEWLNLDLLKNLVQVMGLG